MRTVLLDIRPERYAQLETEIAVWKADRIAEGWQTPVYLNTATSGYRHRAHLAALPAFDHLFQIGDLPQIYIFSGANTHFLQWLPEPRFLCNRDPDIDAKRVAGTDNCSQSGMAVLPYAAPGWLDFDGLVGDPGNGLPGLSEEEQLQQYRLWFARRHEYSVNKGRQFPPKIEFDDRLNSPGYSQFGDAVVAQFASWPISTRRYTPAAVGNWDDGDLKAQTPCAIKIVQEGGYDFQALYQWGHWHELVSCPVQAPICAWFGSHLVRMGLSDSLVREALVDKTENPVKCKAIVSIYDHGGQYNWATVVDGGTVGDALLDSGSFSASMVMSDPTVVLYPEMRQRFAANEIGTGELTMAQFDELKAMIDSDRLLAAQDRARIAALEQGNTTTAPPPPTALAWNLGGPDVGAFKGGNFGGLDYNTLAVTNTINVAGVANAAPAAVYTTGAIGLGTLTLVFAGIAPGNYTLLLHGEESWWASIGARVQDFSVNGVLLFPGVDWFKIAGAIHKAAVVSSPVTIGADGKLVVKGTSHGASDQYVWLCAVELRS